ncbi:MAG: RHS repeat-associated core domain-containing protein [Caldilineaceae bacterium]|nr:RHS repeat-associated core domain-containing protein [Caldilineaceae bacterium]
MRRGSTLYYLHGDHLGSTALTTTGSGAGVSQTYCAYGKTRSGTTCASGNSLTTDRQFTGQMYDVTGLHYYNARYYDDHIGQFVSPDSMVPDPATLIDYNRFAYARANPLKYNDPSGHCSADGSVGDGHKDECWKYVDDIINTWDDTDYWNKRWASKENFLTYVAPTAHNDAEYMMGELNQYWGSDAFKSWKAEQPVPALTSAQLASQADPVCAGEKICQNMVRGAGKVDVYCSQNDCLTQSLDIIATSTAAGAAGCAAGVITAPCSLPLAAISVAASGSGAVWTAYQVYQGHGDEFDLATAGTTLIIGINSTPGVGVAASAYQTYWDFFRPH